MLKNIHYKIFSSESITFYYSSLFFPKKIRDEVAIVYSFLKTIDNFVDMKFPDIKGYKKFKKIYLQSVQGKKSNDKIIQDFVDLQASNKYNQKWIDALFNSMEMDIKHRKYLSMNSTLKYIYGVAEIVGLIMCKTLKLDKRSYKYARALGKAVQYCNMIRDINEDLSWGRIYIPKEELYKYGIQSLDFNSVKENPDKFKKFIRGQLKYYWKWQYFAEDGFKLIPKRYRIVVKTASDMYKWTAVQIQKDPLIIYKNKIKPSKYRVILTILSNFLKINYS